MTLTPQFFEDVCSSVATDPDVVVRESRRPAGYLIFIWHVGLVIVSLQILDLFPEGFQPNLAKLIAKAIVALLPEFNAQAIG